MERHQREEAEEHPEQEDEEEEVERWDVESQLSRVTNTENHPHVLEQRKLDKAFLEILL